MRLLNIISPNKFTLLQTRKSFVPFNKTLSKGTNDYYNEPIDFPLCRDL